MPLPHIHVIFRSCDQVFAVHKTKRPFNLSKSQLIQICFFSLYESIKHTPHSIHILGDNLSSKMKDFFKQFPVSLHDRATMGNDESIRQSYHLAKTLPKKDWVYFCEDDYLHLPHTFNWVHSLLKEQRHCLEYKPKTKWPLLFSGDLRKKQLYLFLADYPDRYTPKGKQPSLIFQTSLAHWRQVKNTTFSFITKTETIRQNLTYLLKSSHRANDYYLSKKLYGQHIFWTKGLCLSPMPSLVTHMQNDTMSPIINWQELYHYWNDLFKSKLK